MAFPIYLAMTAAEIRKNSPLPKDFAYMACHFSPYGTGLSNRPEYLPERSLLILNDRTPIHGHDHGLIAAQLEELTTRFGCSVLLDFQRPDCDETAKLVRFLAKTLPCPVGVSHHYADGLVCPVFLPPVPLDVPLTVLLAPWQDREIWLEGALDGLEITLTDKGCVPCPLLHSGYDGGFPQEQLHCHYHIQTEEDSARFTLFRTREDLDSLLHEAERQGVTMAVGLWQELKKDPA